MTFSARASILRRWLPQRPVSTHKGSCGRVYVLAGSKGMVGAGVLVALGAVKAGAGLVRLGTVKSQQIVAARRAPLEVTTDALPENSLGQLDSREIGKIMRLIDRFNPDVLAVGPGLGASGSIRKIVNRLLRAFRGPVVLDADGLNVMGPLNNRRINCMGPLVITPHPGELASLLGCSTREIQSHREEMARKAAKKLHCVCLLKGAHTIVTDGNSVWRNTTGNPAMASAGMGDLLTGLIAALWGQMPGKDASSGFKAAVLGAYLHGLAGDKGTKRFGGLSIQASAVGEFIPGAIRNLRGKPL